MHSLKRSKSNKYLSDLAIKNGHTKLEKLKFIAIYARLKDPLEFNSSCILKPNNINSFDTCIEFLKSIDKYNINESEEIMKKKKIRLLDICWSEFVTNSDEISDVVVNYYKTFSGKYWNDVKKYNYNTWNNILNAYFEKNKSHWDEIVFHTYKIKLFSEKY